MKFFERIARSIKLSGRRFLPSTPFKKKVSKLLNTIYAQDPSDLIVHDRGRIVREGGELFEIQNDFTDGIYLRRMILQEGTTIVSGIHRRDHVWFLLEGTITISSGDEVETYEAPYVGFSSSGTQRVIYANEYSVFQNVFKNPKGLTSIDDLEDYNYIMDIKK